MELIVQKAVELGVYGIVPFAAKRSVVRLDEKKAGKKQIRWQAIAKGAAEQSGRGLIPEVETVKTYESSLARRAALKSRRSGRHEMQEPFRSHLEEGY